MVYKEDKYERLEFLGPSVLCYLYFIVFQTFAKKNSSHWQWDEFVNVLYISYANMIFNTYPSVRLKLYVVNTLQTWPGSSVTENARTGKLLVIYIILFYALWPF